MKCQNCNENDAVLHYTVLIDGKKIERRLCPACAKSMGYDLPWQEGLSFDSLFASLLGERPEQAEEKTVCPKCGSTWDQISESGKVGCSACYDAFESMLSPYVRKVHGEAQHKGRAPKYIQEHIQLSRKKEQLQADLSSAIEEQRYEAAAVLRDEIRALEKEGCQ